MIRLLQDWLTAQAERQPEALALTMNGQSVTYGQLEEYTNRFARLLKAAGCTRGDRVCFAIPKSPLAITAMLGILKADCIHVPIDTTSPAPRVAKIVTACQPRYILAVRSTVALLEELRAQPSFPDSIAVGWMEGLKSLSRDLNPIFSWDDIWNYSRNRPTSRNTSTDPAQLLFTSGSTGVPKGVIITHSNVIHFVSWASKYFRMTSSDRVSCHPPLHFDLATFDIFGAFSVGAELHLVPPELSVLPNKLANFIRSSRLTQWFSVPSVLKYMAKFDVVKFNDFTELKRLLWCGEVLPTPTIIYLMKRLPRVEFTNLYGPTESTIASSYYTLPSCPKEETASIPIGTACKGEQLLVLDDRRRRMTRGKVGDLYIGGTGLSPGYWRDPAQTAAAFLPCGPRGRDRIYRTGDLARIGDDGLFYFVGRVDSQIKSRGYRIELGEVEAVLNTLHELTESAVVAIPTEAFESFLICCAYVSRNGCQVSHAVLRSKLGKLLPRYMLPSRWMRLCKLPTNSNGKTDRRELSKLFSLESGKPTLLQSGLDSPSRGSTTSMGPPARAVLSSTEPS